MPDISGAPASRRRLRCVPCAGDQEQGSRADLRRGFGASTRFPPLAAPPPEVHSRSCAAPHVSRLARTPPRSARPCRAACAEPVVRRQVAEITPRGRATIPDDIKVRARALSTSTPHSTGVLVKPPCACPRMRCAAPAPYARTHLRARRHEHRAGGLTPRARECRPSCWSGSASSSRPRSAL